MDSETPFRQANESRLAYKSRVSSPAATGAAGMFFEQHASASLLALLLTRGIPPICTDARVTEVHLQTEHLGWKTDDFLLVSVTDNQLQKRLVGQVKRSFAVSHANADFKGAVLDAWQDYCRRSPFNPNTDVFVIVTWLGSSALLRFFTALLESARVSQDGHDFEHRLTIPGFHDKRVFKYFEEVRCILNEYEERSLTFDELRDFLRFLYLLSWDLNSATAQTETWIRNLLAHTSNQPDQVATAKESWNTLLQVVGTGTPMAASFRRENLPLSLLGKHTALSAADDFVFQALCSHSRLILDGIRTVIGDRIHLRRAAIVSQVVDDLERIRAVLIAGEAGGGKSGIAKEACEELNQSGIVFAFRAEEFAAIHLDTTLAGTHPSLSAAKLRTLLATHDRKVVLIESVERLLEASNRGAFTDLMTLVASDPTWHVILTCRDYSVDLVRSSFLESAGLPHAVISIPPLGDEDLREVVKQKPEMIKPLSHPQLRMLLKNPYFLDMAARMAWPDATPFPATERNFRKKFWREVIRNEGHIASGLPTRRDRTFVAVALQRARSLTPFISSSELDAEAIDQLFHVGLLRRSQESDVLVATAHDVLEDWALLEWIEQQFIAGDRDLAMLSRVLGTSPAIRRTYKKWLLELASFDLSSADEFFDSAIVAEDLPSHFVDDTLVSLLRSAHGGYLLDRRSTELLTTESCLLIRIMHLLRVGCVRTPSWMGESSSVASVWCVPDGEAWAAVLKLIDQHFTKFSSTEYSQLVRFIADWSKGISLQDPYPAGAASAASIILKLLPHLIDYRQRNQRKQILAILVKLPLACNSHFQVLLESDDIDYEEDVTDLILTSIDGYAACRDVPDAVISRARREFYLPVNDAGDYRDWGISRQMMSLFGLRLNSHDFFPASGYHGFFLPLLRFHPKQGCAFIIELVNRSSAAYANPVAPLKEVEPPSTLELRFSDGTSRSQWANVRLWNLYRGTSVGPYVLQSALMALENWLLEQREEQPELLDARLVELLRKSESAAITSVVASVVTASPPMCREAGLILARSRECIQLDRVRLVNESQTPSRMFDHFPSLDNIEQSYNHERKEADALEHRQQDIETAVLKLQLTGIAGQVQDVLDAHRAVLPPIEQQDDEDRTWRLAIDRMDLRCYRVTDKASLKSIEHPADEAETVELRHINLEMEPPAADILEFVDRSAKEYAAFNRPIALYHWANGVFKRDHRGAVDPTTWYDQLKAAQSISDNSAVNHTTGLDLNASAQAYVAAVCIRDHWLELSKDDRAWCIDLTCTAIGYGADKTGHSIIGESDLLSGGRAAAFVVSSLMGQELTDSERTRVRLALAQALTHGIDEVAEHAASGAAEFLWSADSNLAIQCLNALATQANIFRDCWNEEQRKPYENRRSFAAVKRESVELVRAIVEGNEAVDGKAYATFATDDWIGADFLMRLLLIAEGAPESAVAINLFQRAAQSLRSWWQMDRHQSRRRGDSTPKRSHKAELAVTKLLERFVLRVAPNHASVILVPILAAIDENPREVSYIIRGLKVAEDRRNEPVKFWFIWCMFAEGLKQSQAFLNIEDSRDSTSSELALAIFLTTDWEKDVRHWRSLDGFSHHVHELFCALPPSVTIFDAYIRFLYHIGEKSLPYAFLHIAGRLNASASENFLSMDNTVFMLETLLRRFVYSRPFEAKREPRVRQAILFLLDALVQAGSSASYRMRDDFVTPINLQ
jgi:hypothetical protein